MSITPLPRIRLSINVEFESTQQKRKTCYQLDLDVQAECFDRQLARGRSLCLPTSRSGSVSGRGHRQDRLYSPERPTCQISEFEGGNHQTAYPVRVHYLETAARCMTSVSSPGRASYGL